MFYSSVFFQCVIPIRNSNDLVNCLIPVVIVSVLFAQRDRFSLLSLFIVFILNFILHYSVFLCFLKYIIINTLKLIQWIDLIYNSRMWLVKGDSDVKCVYVLFYKQTKTPFKNMLMIASRVPRLNWKEICVKNIYIYEIKLMEE